MMKAIKALALLALAAAGGAPAVADMVQAPAAARRIAIVADAVRPRDARVPAEAKRSAYLLVYFKDETHSLYFATSRDGYSFTDVNGGQPIALGRDLADQKGIRDPYIMRGPDGAFYMAMTDLHIFAQREGLRATEWERPGDQYSWGNNRNMIFMKSWDLVHWTHAKVAISAEFPAFADAGCAWAPEVIWDAAKKAPMVYFTTRHGAGPNFMVYSHADPAFRRLTATPRQLLHHPDPKVNVLDADITRVGGKYRMFYVAHEKPGNIRQAVSTTLTSGYVPQPAKVDPETKAAEAPNLWHRHGTKTWVLMYDVFGITPNNMGFAETSDFKTFRNIGRFNEAGSRMKATNFERPKHGAVMAITPDEATKLEGWFGQKE
ncbi:glycoside hydrolase family 43 protein [Sphingomonas sp. KR1UV-12]|uniref:Glycoside hydrolase family 43 protein n=1 Tax=Sphingomonas aurea TaxID=3063994 RepID=A0ABT9EP64_9SPHN|nr:glycoside hydrolase family 43 protein [Sphingomonas sp. KR1UV-12]MDP1028433.1 glycoside hydrolase family 43 protein [Sphingomonas sp. KR1UV-12]